MDTSDVKYIKKDAIVSAFQFRVDSYPDWFASLVSRNIILTHSSYCRISSKITVSGKEHIATKGMYITIDRDDSIAVYTPAYFNETFEPQVKHIPQYSFINEIADSMMDIYKVDSPGIVIEKFPIQELLESSESYVRSKGPEFWAKEIFNYVVNNKEVKK